MPNKILIIDDNPESVSAWTTTAADLGNTDIKVVTDCRAGIEAIMRNGFSMAVISGKLADTKVPMAQLVKECILAGKPVIIHSANLPKRFETNIETCLIRKSVLFFKSPSARDRLTAMRSMLTKQIDPGKVYASAVRNEETSRNMRILRTLMTYTVAFIV